MLRRIAATATAVLVFACCAAAERIELTSAPVDGSDVAMALGLPIWRWQVRAPAGRWTVELWVEDWRKGAEAPQRTNLSTLYVDAPDALVVKLPTQDHPGYAVRVGVSSSLTGALPEPAMESGCSTSPQAPACEAGADAEVLRRIWNANGLYDARTPPTMNDRTLIVKIRFSRPKS